VASFLFINQYLVGQSMPPVRVQVCAVESGFDLAGCCCECNSRRVLSDIGLRGYSRDVLCVWYRQE
jgi:hypothetical protein